MDEDAFMLIGLSFKWDSVTSTAEICAYSHKQDGHSHGSCLAGIAEPSLADLINPPLGQDVSVQVGPSTSAGVVNFVQVRDSFYDAA